MKEYFRNASKEEQIKALMKEAEENGKTIDWATIVLC